MRIDSCRNGGGVLRDPVEDVEADLERRNGSRGTNHRLAPLAPPERTFVICGPAHAAPVAR